MKRLLFASLFIFSSALGASNLTLFMESSKAWIGALNGATKLGLESPAYLPDYGIAFVHDQCEKYSERGADDLVQLKALTAALGATIKGVDPKDWLSITENYVCGFGEPKVQVTARIKGADIGKDLWEIWVDGKKL